MSGVECTHTEMIERVDPSSKAGCSECLRTGGTWMHLRLCLSCGEVGCCDSSPNQHASKHAVADQHPIAGSYEPGEDWAWCYTDEVMLDATALGLPSHD